MVRDVMCVFVVVFVCVCCHSTPQNVATESLTSWFSSIFLPLSLGIFFCLFFSFVLSLSFHFLLLHKFLLI